MTGSSNTRLVRHLLVNRTGHRTSEDIFLFLRYGFEDFWDDSEILESTDIGYAP